MFIKMKMNLFPLAIAVAIFGLLFTGYFWVHRNPMVVSSLYCSGDFVSLSGRGGEGRLADRLFLKFCSTLVYRFFGTTHIYKLITFCLTAEMLTSFIETL